MVQEVLQVRLGFVTYTEAAYWTATFNWAASSEFGTYRLCEQRRFRRACASTQSRQNLRCSLIQAVSQEEPSNRKPDPWPLWMAGHAQLKFVTTECSKTQIRLTGPNLCYLLTIIKPINKTDGDNSLKQTGVKRKRLIETLNNSLILFKYSTISHDGINLNK